MRDCHDCTFESLDERNPYYRCLVFYGQGVAIEKIKDGLIGRCDKYKPANPDAVNTVALTDERTCPNEQYFMKILEV